MANVALHSASTGLSALSTQIDVIANNLANSNTDGFKTMRANFENLLYHEKQQPGVENANGDRRPSGLYVGLGTRVSNTQIDFSTGSPRLTGNELDLMIDGQGFFRVQIREAEGGGVGYVRSGNFTVNGEGDLVLGSTDGPRMVPNINLPDNYREIGISADGTVNVFVAGDPEPQNVGQIEVARFVNPHGLKPLSGNIYVESAASGPAIEGVPGDQNFGTILQGAVESSNVNPINELVNLIRAQRSFEMNSQVIQAADQTLQVIGQLRR